MEEILKFIYEFKFKLLGFSINSNDIVSTINSMLNFNTMKSTSGFTLWTAASSVNKAIVPLGVSLLTLFIIIDYIKMTQEGVERITWERIVLKGAWYYFLYFLINNSFKYLTTIAEIVQDGILAKFMSNMAINTAGIKSISSILASVCEAQGPIMKYIFLIIFVLLAIPYIATIMMVISQVFVRVVKLMIYFMIAPIPIAMAAESEAFRGKAITFFMNFAGVCFEAAVIYVGLFVYAKGLAGLGTMSGTNYGGVIIGALFMNGVFAAIIGLGGQLSKEIFGRG